LQTSICFACHPLYCHLCFVLISCYRVLHCFAVVCISSIELCFASGVHGLFKCHGPNSSSVGSVYVQIILDPCCLFAFSLFCCCFVFLIGNSFLHIAGICSSDVCELA
jgi:hypothetical protein